MALLKTRLTFSRPTRTERMFLLLVISLAHTSLMSWAWLASVIPRRCDGYRLIYYRLIYYRLIYHQLIYHQLIYSRARRARPRRHQARAHDERALGHPGPAPGRSCLGGAA